MMPLEIVEITIVGCSALYIPAFMMTLKRERQVIEQASKLLAEERRQFFNAMQDKSAANALTPCRTCVTCKRVVHRYSPVSGGVLCYECDVTKKAPR